MCQPPGFGIFAEVRASDFEELVRRRLREQGLTANSAETKGGLKQDTIARVLRGHVPGLDKVDQICRALGLDHHIGIPGSRRAEKPRPPARAEERTEPPAWAKAQHEELIEVMMRAQQSKAPAKSPPGPAKTTPGADVLVESMRMFWTYGYNAVSIGDIERRTGQQVGTDDTKRQLLLRSLDLYARDYCVGPMAEAAKRPSARAAWKEMLDAEIKAATESQDGCLEINMALEVAPHDEEVAAQVTRVLRTIERVLENVVRRGQNQGVFRRTENPKEVARHVLALIVSIRVFARLWPGRRPLLRSVAAHCRQVIEKGYGPGEKGNS